MTAPYLLVLAHARSGSNYLLDLLGALDGVSTLGEFFNTASKAQGQNHREAALAPFGGDPVAFMDAARQDPLSTLEFRKKIKGVKLFVVKVLGSQMQNEANRRALIDNAAGVVILRRNIFATWTSRALVKHTKAWVNSTSDEYSVDFDRDSFLRTGYTVSTNAAELARLVRESGKPSVTLSYSELESIGSPEALWKRISASIPGLPELNTAKGWKPKVARQDNRLPIDRVANREEAITALRKLGLEYLLNNNDSEDLDHLLRVFNANRVAPRKKRKPSRNLFVRAFRKLNLAKK